MSGCTCSSFVLQVQGCDCAGGKRERQKKAHEEWKALTYAKLGVLRVIMTKDEVDAVERFIELGL